mgnify:CR=1 FL=1
MKVAVVEKESLGGICLNWGCIPTKALLKSANEYKSQLEMVKKQIAKKQNEAEQRIKTLQENAEKNIFESAVSISATILSKLEYNNINKDEIENILKKSKK